MRRAFTGFAALLVAALVGWPAETMAQAPRQPTPRPEGTEAPAAPERLREAPGAEAPEQKETGNREHVKEAQRALKEKGPIDGIMGPRTPMAVKDFQRSEGLPETGRLDAETMAKLGATTPGEPMQRTGENPY